MTVVFTRITDFDEISYLVSTSISLVNHVSCMCRHTSVTHSRCYIEEVDEEYWDRPIPAGGGSRQPRDIPSNMAFFNCSLRLGQILSFALRTIYTINKSKVLLGFIGPHWEQHIVAELGGFALSQSFSLRTFG